MDGVIAYLQVLALVAAGVVGVGILAIFLFYFGLWISDLFKIF